MTVAMPRDARMVVGLLWLGTFPACNGKESAETCRPVRAPTGAVLPGDATADGVVDLADVVSLRDHLFAGGPEPACRAASEVIVEDGEAANLWTTLAYAFQGTTILVDAKPDCAPAEAAADVCAGALEIVPTRSGQTIELRGLTEDDAVQAWSFGVETEGCTITSASTNFTAGALVLDGGQRHGGYDHTEVKDGHAVSAVMLENFAQRGLPKGDHSLLSLDLEGSCGPCTVRVVDGLSGSGQPVPAIVVIDGKPVVPQLRSLTFELCP
jgi:hypothetical protein